MNNDLFTIGMAMSLGLVILSGASILLFPIASESDIEFQKRIARERYLHGQFLLGWLWASLYLVWFGLIFPKPRGNSIL